MAELYLDANATTRLRAGAHRAVSQLLERRLVGNPSSIHGSGRPVRGEISRARRLLLRLVNPSGEQELRLVFTSGGTEACNTAIFGFIGGHIPGSRIVTSAIEHQAVLEPCKELARRGAEIVLIPPNSEGVATVPAFLETVTENTQLVSLMVANNVNGAIQPVAELARSLRKQGYRGVIFSDCSQLVGKSSISPADLFAAGVDACAFSAHKMGALAGSGALIYAEHSSRCHLFSPLLLGGPQEERLRAGSENLIGIMAWAGAVEELLAEPELNKSIARTAELRDKLRLQLETGTVGVRFATPAGESSALSNTLAVAFSGVRGDDLVVALDLAGVRVSTGSACSSGRQEVSYVFREMGLERAEEFIRICLDWDATSDLIERASRLILQCVQQMRAVAKDS